MHAAELLLLSCVGMVVRSPAVGLGRGVALRSPPPRLDLAPTFGDLPVPQHLSDRLLAAGYARPMPIQSAAMALVAAGENVVIHAATGSGRP